eukprot:scaffold273_cov242-Pinguiococcus_pyrenoidosus.AAC.31
MRRRDFEARLLASGELYEVAAVPWLRKQVLLGSTESRALSVSQATEASWEASQPLWSPGEGNGAHQAPRPAGCPAGGGGSRLRTAEGLQGQGGLDPAGGRVAVLPQPGGLLARGLQLGVVLLRADALEAVRAHVPAVVLGRPAGRQDRQALRPVQQARRRAGHGHRSLHHCGPAGRAGHPVPAPGHLVHFAHDHRPQQPLGACGIHGEHGPPQGFQRVGEPQLLAPVVLRRVPLLRLPLRGHGDLLRAAVRQPLLRQQQPLPLLPHLVRLLPGLLHEAVGQSGAAELCVLRTGRGRRAGEEHEEDIERNV